MNVNRPDTVAVAVSPLAGVTVTEAVGSVANTMVYVLVAPATTSRSGGRRFAARGVIVDPQTLDVVAGATSTYTIVLATRPTASVTVTPASGDTATATVSGALTFTVSDWATAQTVTVSGGAAGFRVGLSPVSGGDYGSNNDGVRGDVVGPVVAAGHGVRDRHGTAAAPLTVTVCAVAQSDTVNVNAPTPSPWPCPRSAGVTVTEAVGRVAKETS